MIIGNGMSGLWWLASLRAPRLQTRALVWFTAIVEVAIVVQVALGVWIYTGFSSAQVARFDKFHMFYGFVAIIAGAIMYSYRQQLRHRVELLYGLGGLFLMGLGIRALLKA